MLFPPYARCVRLIPAKMMREWKELLMLGLPLYEPGSGDSDPGPLSAPLDPVQRQKEELLNDQDYQEYTVSERWHLLCIFSLDISNRIRISGD